MAALYFPLLSCPAVKIKQHLGMALIATAPVYRSAHSPRRGSCRKALRAITSHTSSTSVPAKCCPNFVSTANSWAARR